MKKIMKRTAAVALAGVLTAGMLSGCGKKEEVLDGSAIVATVDGAEITMGLLSLRTRQVQAEITDLYAAYLGTTENIWNQEVDSETGETYGEQTIKDCLNQTEMLYILKAKAADYGVEITEEDQEKIAEAAAAFMAANSEEVIAALAVTEQDVKDYLELETYSQRMYNAIIADVDTVVSDEEAQQSSFKYLNVDVTDMEDDAVAAEKESLQGIIDAVKADEKTDLKTEANAVNEEYTVLAGTYTTHAWEESSYPEEIMKVLVEMKDGEICDTVIETETDGLYVVMMEQVFDKEETEGEKESIISERETELYTTTTETWLSEAEITVDEKVLAALKLKDNKVFSFKALEETSMEEEVFVDEELLEEDMEIVEDEEFIEDEIIEDEVFDEEAFSEDEELMELTDDEMEELEAIDEVEEVLEEEDIEE